MFIRGLVGSGVGLGSLALGLGSKARGMAVSAQATEPGFYSLKARNIDGDEVTFLVSSFVFSRGTVPQKTSKVAKNPNFKRRKINYFLPSRFSLRFL